MDLGSFLYGSEDKMKKPKWLKKAYPSKPWKYKLMTEEGIEIEPYNFNSYFGQDLREVDKAIEWIDQQIKKEE